MKTAEAWIADLAIGSAWDKREKDRMVQLFKAIQLDAWKAGITHAAVLIANRPQDDFVGILLNERDEWTAL